MLISFSVTNWMSFRDRVTLSVVASRERQHGRRVARLGRYQMRVLPIMALYGGNASGKTNLVKALSFAKTRIVEGSAPGGRIPVIPFLLDNDCAQQPSRFEFEILIAGCVYALSFSVTGEKVIEERLVRVGSTSERTLYARRHGDYIFDRTLRENLFLEYLRRGTRDNQLFLTNSVSQNVENFKDIYNWFNDNLQIITPETRYGLPSFYLAACTPRIRAQLLFTTHDVLLMDQRWLRRDEMWVTERDTSGASSLLSFSEYRDVRYDKDIRKSYLQGRLGGIPRINPTESVQVGAE